MDNIEPYKNLSLQDIEGEQWRDIEGWEGYYQISNFGRVKSLERVIERTNGRLMKVKEIIKKQVIQINGRYNYSHHYLQINLKRVNYSETKTVAKLVGDIFLPEEKAKLYIFHIDDNFLDNRVSNLMRGDNDDLSRFGRTAKQNIPRKGNGYIGVSPSLRYRMSIGIEGKEVIETFQSELEAAKKYDYYVKKYKLNRKLNFPEDKEHD